MTGQPEVVDLLRVQFELMRFIRASILAASASILPDRGAGASDRFRSRVYTYGNEVAYRIGSRYAARRLLTLSAIDR